MTSIPDIGPVDNLAPGLYLVATPIGNMLDLGLRAISILKSADSIACEDTRVTGKLLARHGIKSPMKPYHEHNAAKSRPELLRIIENGGALALVSDAGTPMISDPGYKLVKECIERNFSVTTIPGANAAITALILSGLPTNRFFFAGFLNNKAKKRRQELSELSIIPATLIFFEPARRLLTTLKVMFEQFGERPAAIARELTKSYEEIRRDLLSSLITHYSKAGPPKGEVVIVVGGYKKNASIMDAKLDQFILKQLQRLSIRDTTTKVASETGLSKREIYARAIKLRKEPQI